MNMPKFDDVASSSTAVAGLCDRLRDSGTLPVGVAPNSIVQAKATKAGLDYVAFMAGVVSTIAEQGYLPVLIPHSYREGTSKAHNNDRSLCAAIIDRLDSSVDYYYVDEDLDSGQLRALIGRLHLLVASRFHSMISSLSVGVPPLTYGWGHHKYTEVLEEFDVVELYSPFKDLDVPEFAEKLARVSADREELSRRIVGRYATIRAQSENIPQLIIDALG
jgi:hypothetical protein